MEAYTHVLKKAYFLKIKDSWICSSIQRDGGHAGSVVTLSPPTSEAGVRFPARPQVGKLVVACRWSTVNSTEL